MMMFVFDFMKSVAVFFMSKRR